MPNDKVRGTLIHGLVQYPKLYMTFREHFLIYIIPFDLDVNRNVSVFVSVLTLTSISVERYLAICHPLTYHGTYFKTRLVLILIWFVSLGTPSLSFMNMTLKHDDEIPETLRPWLSSCAPENEEMEKIFQIFLIVAFYLFPLGVMTYTYVSIAACLWSSTSRGNAVSQSLQYESALEQLKVRRRTAKMLIVVVITFGLCYLPIYILNIIRYTHALDSLHQNIDALFCLFWTARFFCYFNSAVNPVIYNFMSVKFRKQFKTACHGCYSCMSCCFKERVANLARTVGPDPHGLKNTNREKSISSKRLIRNTEKGIPWKQQTLAREKGKGHPTSTLVMKSFPSRTNNMHLTSSVANHS